MTADDNYIRESILNPPAKVVAGWSPVMPTYQGQMTEEQLAQLIAYIRSLSDTAAAPVAPAASPAAGASPASPPNSDLPPTAGPASETQP